MERADHFRIYVPTKYGKSGSWLRLAAFLYPKIKKGIDAIAGAGTPSPVLDFTPLTDILKNDVVHGESEF